MAQSNSAPPVDVRIELVGSIFRPPWLKEAFVRHRAGELGDDELRAAQDRAIRQWKKIAVIREVVTQVWG